MCQVSFLEIYNERIFDLLDTSCKGKQLREDMKSRVVIPDLTELTVESHSEAVEVCFFAFRWIGVGGGTSSFLICLVMMILERIGTLIQLPKLLKDSLLKQLCAFFFFFRLSHLADVIEVRASSSFAHTSSLLFSTQQVLKAGNRNRRVAETSMNRESSRSHAVFTMSIKSTVCLCVVCAIESR